MNQRLTPWILFAATALVYLLFPTRVYYWDGITFAQAIEDAQSLDASLVHPNHLLYNFAGYFFYKLLRTFGIELRALTALQILNSFLSAICASVLFAILKDTLRSLYLAVCLTLLFAFSATWWKFSTDANAYVPSVLFLLVSFYLVLPERRARPWLVAMTFFLSMAFHQLAVLMFPVLALGVYLQAGAVSIKRGVMNALYFSILSAALILAPYAYLFSLARGSFDIRQFARWLTYYSPDADTQFRVWSNLLYTLRGHVRLFFGGRFNLLNDLVNPAIVLLLACLVAAVLWLLFSFLRNLGARNRDVENRKFRLQPHEKSVLLLSLVWAIVYVVFLFFFLPQNTFYRLFYLPALILLLGLGLSSLKNKACSSWRLAVFAAAVCLANFLFLIYPFSHVEKYPPLAFALQMNDEWPAGTVIYYGAESSDVSLVRYFTPGTHWRRLDNKIFAEDQPVWLETSAINAVDPHWLETHARRESLKELADSGFRIRFLRVEP